MSRRPSQRRYHQLRRQRLRARIGSAGLAVPSLYRRQAGVAPVSKRAHAPARNSTGTALHIGPSPRPWHHLLPRPPQQQQKEHQRRRHPGAIRPVALPPRSTSKARPLLPITRAWATHPTQWRSAMRPRRHVASRPYIGRRARTTQPRSAPGSVPPLRRRGIGRGVARVSTRLCSRRPPRARPAYHAPTAMTRVHTSRLLPQPPRAHTEKRRRAEGGSSATTGRGRF